MKIYQRQGADNGFVWGDIFSSFDKLVNEVCDTPLRINSSITSAQFPPSNVLINKETKDLKIQCALAGYKKDDIYVEFDDDRLKVIIDKKATHDIPKGAEEPTELVVQRGIKCPQYTDLSFRIDTRFYDQESAKVSFEDGLLEIILNPLEAVKPRKITLFGEKKIEKIEDKTE